MEDPENILNLADNEDMNVFICKNKVQMNIYN